MDFSTQRKRPAVRLTLSLLEARTIGLVGTVLPLDTLSPFYLVE
jgi:hypothetical protein